MTETAAHIIQNFFGTTGAAQFLTHHWPGTGYSQHGESSRLPPLFHAPMLTDLSNLAGIYRGPGFYFSGNGSELRSFDLPPMQLYRSGHTIYFGDVAPFVRGSRIFLKALESELGVTPGCARMGLFASPAHDGAAVHYDTNDVFSIQISGHKKFNVAPVKELKNPTGMQYSTRTTPLPVHFAQMSAGFPDPSDVQFETVDMAPGSVLYMPRGTWHCTEASEDSIAVSVILNPPPAVDAILEQLKFTLLQEEQWRAPLYGAWNASDTNARQNLQRLLDQCQKTLTSFTPEQILYGCSSRGYRVENISAETRFQRIPTARVERNQWSAGSWQVTVVNNDLDRGERETLNIDLNQQGIDVLDAIMKLNSHFRGDEIAAAAGVEFSEITDLLKAFCQGELLMPLWFDPVPTD